MKVEYGRAWDWFLKLIFKEKLVHHDKWVADVFEEYYAPGIKESIEQRHERLWAGEQGRWEEEDEEWKDLRRRGYLGCRTHKAHAVLRVGYKSKETNEHKDS